MHNEQGVFRPCGAIGAGVLGVVVTLAAGCAGPGPATAPTATRPERFTGLAAGERAAQPTSPATPQRKERPAALLDGALITWEDLRPMLAEAAGGVVLQEAALDRLIDREMRARGQSITPEDLAAERGLIVAAIVRDARATPDDAERLLERVRRGRGLGEVRFAHLLERNAKMRKMIAGTVQVSEQEIAQAFEMLHGAKYRARVILVPNQATASQIKDELAGDAGDPAIRFGAAAAKYSTDPSAARGGITDPISPADATYPASVRKAVETLPPGQVSDVLAVDRGFALVMVEEKIPEDGTKLEEAAPAIRAEVLARRERVAMDELARGLLQKAHLSAMDRELEWSLRNGAGTP